MKDEIAQEPGPPDKEKQVGWAGLSAKETGRIGGMIGAKRRSNEGMKK